MIRRNLLIAWSLAVASPAAFAGLTTQDLNTLTPGDLATILAGTGVVVSNVTHTGAPVSAGTFAGGANSAGGTAGIGIASGVILSSGNIANVVGPNTLSGVSTPLGLPGDPDLTVLAGRQTFDATVLEFDFIPNADQVFFQYIFASDEYNEFVNSNFNDVFAFFVNGVNCAMVGNPAVPVSVNTINNGPFGSGGPNALLYKNNDLASGAKINTEMDGLTVVLPCQAAVTPNVINHMKLAIADAQDSVLDSNALVKGGSITTLPPVEAALAKTQFRCKVTNCTPSITCNFAGPLGSSCKNRIRLLVRRNVLRSGAETQATTARTLFAAGLTNIPPGRTRNVRLKLTNRAKRFVKTTTQRTIRAVMEIRNVAGTAVLRIPGVRIRLG
ncbi:MAG: choice-of-anchor L domain-containing protein [Gammaproteobacteria bacterium]